MTNLTENEIWEEGVYQIELTDPVVGGPDGISNRQAKQLANRTTWLKAKFDALIAGTVSAYKATRLATARTLSITGAGTGSASFDGSANAAIALTLADSGVVAGAYPKVTVNAKGLVTGGDALAAGDIPSLPWSKITSGKPNSLAGYGITDALAAVNFTWGNLGEKPTTLGGFGISDGVLATMSGDWSTSDSSRVMRSGTNGPMGTTIVGGLKAVITAGNIHTNFVGRNGRAFFQTMGDGDSDWHEINAWDWITGKPTTLGGYGITDAVASANFTFANLGGKPSTLGGYGITDAVASANFTFANLGGKPTTLLGYGITDAVAAANFTFANLGGKPTTLAGYGITDGVHMATAGDWAEVNASRMLRTATNGPLGGTIVGGLQAVITAGSFALNVAGRNGRAFFQTLGDADNAWKEFNAWSAITGKPTTLAGYGITDAVTSASFTFANLGGKPTTLAGYGVSFASQAQAEAGADTNAPMNALRVFQAIAAKVVQATESVLGIARIATQIQVDAGTDDTTIVTPKKLRLGVTYSFGTNGYLFLPQWLGGFGIQWVVGPSFTSGSNQVVNFPVPFPNASYGTWIEQASGSASVNWSPSALNASSVTVYCHGPSVGTPRILAIGR